MSEQAWLVLVASLLSLVAVFGADASSAPGVAWPVGVLWGIAFYRWQQAMSRATR